MRKTTGGGGALGPPPAGRGLTLSFICRITRWFYDTLDQNLRSDVMWCRSQSRLPIICLSVCLSVCVCVSERTPRVEHMLLEALDWAAAAAEPGDAARLL